MVVVLGKDLLADGEVLPSLLYQRVQLLHSRVDLPPVVLKDVHLLTVGQLAVLLVLDVFIQQVEFFVAGAEVLQLVVVEVHLLHDFLILGLALFDVEEAAEVLLLRGAVLVGLELGVELDGPLILGRGVVDVEIEEGVVDLLLDPVLVGHAQQVLCIDGQEEVNFALLDLLVVEDE